MVVSLGKRKRRSPQTQPESDPEDEQDLRARFQRAFEAKFKPLEGGKAKSEKEDATDLEEADDNAEDSDWSGFSEDDVDDQVQVIAHETAGSGLPEFDRSQQKAYMSSKPPSSDVTPGKTSSKQKVSEEDEVSEAANLKHDLALQRLLKESHLLDPTSFSGKNSEPTGKSRLKALDMRLQDLGAKESLSAQNKMPLSHRKGIASKAAGREQKRRKDAAENGVILEKAKHASKESNAKRRERSVGGPTVGKFRGGTLKLSGKDLRDIQGPKKQGKGKKGRK